LRLTGPVSVEAHFSLLDMAGPISTAPVTTVPIATVLRLRQPVEIPVVTSWNVADPREWTSSTLELSVNGGGDAAVPLGGGKSVRSTAVPAVRYQYRTRASDGDNTGEWTVGTAFVVDGFLPPYDSVSGGDWTLGYSATAWLGAIATTSSPAASATFPVTGQEVAIVARTEHNLGGLQIYVDGQLRQTVPTAYDAPSAPRIVAAVPLGGGTHTLRIARDPSVDGPIELQGVITLNSAA
jgi:hypothetical protein